MFALFKSMTPILAVAVLEACTATPLAPTQSTPVIISTAVATIAPAATSNLIVTAAPPATPVSAATTGSAPTTPHVTPIPTDTPIPTPEPLFQCRLAATTTADKYPGWLQCISAKYGFSFRYPPDWILKEIVDPVNTMSGHAVHLTHPTNPSVRMIIAFKRANEDRRITPTGIGSGDLITRGVVSLLGQDVERNVLVALEKDMGVYYGWPRSAATGSGLVFWLALDCACPAGDAAVTGLTPEVEQIADAIVESIEVTK
jgi:hypothetical protein